MSTIPRQETELSHIAREMDSPTAVIWTSMEVMKRCLEKIAAGALDHPKPAIDQLRQSMDLAAAASERLIKVNRNLQRAIRLNGE